MASGIQLSVSIISGLGGEEHWEAHATETARVMNNINPTYIGLLTLVVEKDSDIEQQVNNGTMTLLTPLKVMLETKKFIEHTQLTHTLFRGNHASNYVPFSATLGAEKDQLLTQIDQVIECNHTFKSDEYRRV
jgi:radical SAM superfamily enzyme